MRIDGRSAAQLRKISIEPHYLNTAEGSALVSFGDTKVICTATVENNTPPHRRDTGKGWLTAEYAMLPRSSKQRIPRDGTRGRVNGRGQEIQRLIGRVLRAAFDMDRFGERTIIVDCDVIQADGGTRTAAITGGFVAVGLAMRRLIENNQSAHLFLRDYVGAVSVGIVEGAAALDLCYLEDSQAEVDLNLAMTAGGEIIEVQGAAEGAPFPRAQLDAMLEIGANGIQEIVKAQKEILGFEMGDKGLVWKR